MITLTLTFILSIIGTFLLIKFQDYHLLHTSDSDLSGPQKIHQKPVPRIGGLGIVLGILGALFIKTYSNPQFYEYTLAIFGCAIPVFIIGLTEDLTKKISVRIRFMTTIFVSTISVLLLDLSIKHVGVYLIDNLLALSPLSQIIAIIALTGLANSYNLIDGLNGLASMIGMLALLSLSYVSLKNNDLILMNLCMLTIGGILGFFVWNFPKGLIFLGDGGSYFIGFIIAVISIALVNRNPSVSPWFVFVLNLYPIFETLFTIWRRLIYQRKNPTHPDGSHFHTLIYKRILKHNKNESKHFGNNSKASPYLWVLALTAILPATLFWDNQFWLQFIAVCFSLIYLCIYKLIVSFRTPKWLKN